MIETVEDKTFTDKINDVDITIGNEKVSAEFQANVKMRFWDEDDIWLELPNVKGSPTLKDDKVTLDLPVGKYEWYKDTDGNLRWIFIFKSKPPKNTYSLNIGGNWQDFNFNYQTPFPTPTKFTKDNEEWVRWIDPLGLTNERPRKVDGSYAVYHKTKKDYVVGQKNYKAGKAFHIYLPKVTDAVGKTVWCTLHIENGIYTVTVPQTFLDSAVYPIRINDTFGITTVGVSTTGSLADYIGAFGPWTPASDGSATSVSLYTGSTQRPVTLGIYDNDAGGPNNLLRDTAGGTSVSSGWTTQTLDSALSVTNGTNYWPGKNNDDGSLTIRYDGGSLDWYYKAQAYSAGSLPDPFPASPSNLPNRDYSIYVTYTPSGGAVAPTGNLWGPLGGCLRGVT